MTCKDCLHCEVCDFWEKETYNAEPAEWDGSICKYFLNKGRMAEVPCIIGQPMWKLCTWYHAPAEILESRVSMIQQKVNGSWKVRISNRYGTDDIKAEDIGNYVFFTKEEAEEALAKME